jgi:transcriptional regulator with XRE-family HTH domain
MFAGPELKALRLGAGLGQAEMAARLGLSISYLSQLESADRPLTVNVVEALMRAFPLDWRQFDADEATRRLAAMREAIADPLFAEPPPSAEVLNRSVEQQPFLADRFLRLHAAYRRSEERLQIIDDRIASGVPGGGRLPWEEVRDWFHDAGNYVDAIDRGAEALAAELPDSANSGEPAIVARLEKRHGLTVAFSASDGGSAPLRALDRATGRLTLDQALPAATDSSRREPPFPACAPARRSRACRADRRGCGGGRVVRARSAAAAVGWARQLCGRRAPDALCALPGDGARAAP